MLKNPPDKSDVSSNDSGVHRDTTTAPRHSQESEVSF
jgi:hypothetical protein